MIVFILFKPIRKYFKWSYNFHFTISSEINAIPRFGRVHFHFEYSGNPGKFWSIFKSLSKCQASILHNHIITDSTVSSGVSSYLWALWPAWYPWFSQWGSSCVEYIVGPDLLRPSVPPQPRCGSRPWRLSHWPGLYSHSPCTAKSHKVRQMIHVTYYMCALFLTHALYFI